MWEWFSFSASISEDSNLSQSARKYNRDRNILDAGGHFFRSEIMSA